MNQWSQVAVSAKACGGTRTRLINLCRPPLRGGVGCFAGEFADTPWRPTSSGVDELAAKAEGLSSLRSSVAVLRPSRQAGFTLVEILAVMAILLAVVGITLGLAGRAQQNAARNRIRADIKTIDAAVEKYHAENGIYPASLGAAGVSIKDPFGNDYHYVPAGLGYKIWCKGEDGLTGNISDSSDDIHVD